MGAFPVQRQGGDLSTFHNWVAPPLHCHHHHHRNNYHHHRHRHRHRNYYHHLHVIIVTVINNLSPSLPMMLVE